MNGIINLLSECSIILGVLLHSFWSKLKNVVLPSKILKYKISTWNFDLKCWTCLRFKNLFVSDLNNFELRHYQIAHTTFSDLYLGYYHITFLPSNFGNTFNLHPHYFNFVRNITMTTSDFETSTFSIHIHFTTHTKTKLIAQWLPHVRAQSCENWQPTNKTVYYLPTNVDDSHRAMTRPSFILSTGCKIMSFK